MDLEHLNKSQIVLLTLLVSFVTSIATGIVAVTLMEQAPPAITQTVNRIVERTVEKVVPQQGQVAAATNVVTEKIVTVQEEDKVAKAVAVVNPSVVRLYTPGKDESGKEMQVFVGIAIVTSAEGVLMADAGTPDGTLTAVRSDGESVKVTILERVPGMKILHLQAATSSEGEATSTKSLSWRPATFSTVVPRLGEAVVVLGGRVSTRVATGIVSALGEGDSPDSLEVSIDSENYSAGSPLIDTDGEIIGIATRATRDSGIGFLASSAFLLDNGTTAKDEKKTAGE